MQQMKSLANKVVIVSGGASGLGAAVVKSVADAGGVPVVLDQNVQAVQDVQAHQVDVSNSAAVAQAVADVAQSCGGIDAVVTAAGIDRCGRLEDVPAQEWDKVVMVNLLGTAAVIRAAMPWLQERHGSVVTVASSLGLRALPEASAYCASKFGVIGFSRALAAENKGRVGVTTLIPAGMKTHFFDDRAEQYKPSDDSRLNDPQAVANAVVFALTQPRGCEVRELVICHEEEDSWP
ncbi:SDR family oxidoreductase [Specibacter sp. NPDC057265]|uniref:SDR family oxidoreductase n=1 Tax=Specibacter sp. NPDC057265 TaxID=3346075 RepID=UPI00363C784D